MNEGIYYWRTAPQMDLPIGTMTICKDDSNYNENNSIERQQETQAETLLCAVDSDHAGDISHHKLVTGICIKIAGGAVLWKTVFQTTCALSSTEAEFTTASTAGKYILYLHTILQEIGLRQEAATILYKYNQGALLMAANAQKPTKRTRHLNIKYFSLQDWVKNDLIELKRISTHDNWSDAMTKAQGHTLFHRHMNYILGKIVPNYTFRTMNLRTKVLCDTRISSFYKPLMQLSREGVLRRFCAIPII